MLIFDVPKSASSFSNVEPVFIWIWARILESGQVIGQITLAVPALSPVIR
jgi:hypothetical protein